MNQMIRNDVSHNQAEGERNAKASKMGEKQMGVMSNSMAAE